MCSSIERMYDKSKSQYMLYVCANIPTSHVFAKHGHLGIISWAIPRLRAHIII